jgi:hypothetical protein
MTIFYFLDYPASLAKVKEGIHLFLLEGATNLPLTMISRKQFKALMWGPNQG